MASYSLMVTISLLALLLLAVKDALAAVELPAYRMQQYELLGIFR